MIIDLLAANILQGNYFFHIHVILFICISNKKKIESREAKAINTFESGTVLGISNITIQVTIALANHLEVTH